MGTVIVRRKPRIGYHVAEVNNVSPEFAEAMLLQGLDQIGQPNPRIEGPRSTVVRIARKMWVLGFIPVTKYVQVPVVYDYCGDGTYEYCFQVL